VRWRLIDLSQWIYEEFRITVAKQTLSRELLQIRSTRTELIAKIARGFCQNDPNFDRYR
jgi:hypothetical protein